MLDQILANPVIRFVVFGIAGAMLVAIGWGAADHLVRRVALSCPASRRPDRRADARGARAAGHAMSRPDSIRWPGLVAAVCMLALAALEIAIMVEVGSE